MKINAKFITVVSSGDVMLRDVSTSSVVIEKTVITPRTIAVKDERPDNNFLFYLNKKLEGDRVFMSQVETKRGSSNQGTR